MVEPPGLQTSSLSKAGCLSPTCKPLASSAYHRFDIKNILARRIFLQVGAKHSRVLVTHLKTTTKSSSMHCNATKKFQLLKILMSTIPVIQYKYPQYPQHINININNISININININENCSPAPFLQHPLPLLLPDQCQLSFKNVLYSLYVCLLSSDLFLDPQGG